MTETNSLLSKLAAENAALKACIRAGADAILLAPAVAERLRATLDGGQVAITVVDAKGNPRIGSSQGETMTADQLVAEMARDPAFAPCFAKQSGAKDARRTQDGALRRSKMDHTAKAAYIESHGPDAFLELPD